MTASNKAAAAMTTLDADERTSFLASSHERRSYCRKERSSLLSHEGDDGVDSKNNVPWMVVATTIVAFLVVIGGSRYWNDDAPRSEVTDHGSNHNRIKVMRSSSNSNTNNHNHNHNAQVSLTLSFDDFLTTFGKDYDDYDKPEEEYSYRKSIYESNLETMRDHNDDAETHGWTMGINRFADLLPHEIHKGFHKDMLRVHSEGEHEHNDESSLNSPVFSSLLEDEQHHQNQRVLRVPGSGSSSSRLPAQVDWRTQKITTPVKDQGRCGSCWAFAATAVLESHAALATGELFSLSPQELVSCAPNPNHCGGDRGCSGATGEVAYEYVSKKGMVTEWSYGYTSYHGDSGTCRFSDNDNTDDPFSSGHYLPSAKIGLVGYASLPTNDYDALMYAVATMGPVVVSVAANAWGLYRGGVFDDFDRTEHYDVNHAVVLEGYGTDPETLQDYWLVRNSWGVLWGEDGYIRLKRTSPSNNDRHRCKMDITPAHGVSCTGPDGNATIPDQLVCGTSGILYANVVPVGAHLL